MRLISDEFIAGANAEFEGLRDQLDGFRAEMLDHPIAGHCLRNYVILTLRPEFVRGANLSGPEIYWSRYYWLARFNFVWRAITGFDAGLEQQLFQLLEIAPDGLEYLSEIEKEAKRAATEQLRAAGIG